MMVPCLDKAGTWTAKLIQRFVLVGLTSRNSDPPLFSRVFFVDMPCTSFLFLPLPRGWDSLTPCFFWNPSSSTVSSFGSARGSARFAFNCVREFCKRLLVRDIMLVSHFVGKNHQKRTKGVSALSVVPPRDVILDGLSQHKLGSQAQVGNAHDGGLSNQHFTARKCHHLMHKFSQATSLEEKAEMKLEEWRANLLEYCPHEVLKTLNIAIPETRSPNFCPKTVMDNLTSNESDKL